MNRSKKHGAFAVLLALGVLALPATGRALLVDFTQAPWAAAHGQSSYGLPYSLGGKTITLTVSASVPGTVLYHSASGFGVTRSSGDLPTASDCLYILKAAVGLVACSPECVCAPTGSLPIVATDALLCLKKAVGQTVSLACPCG